MKKIWLVLFLALASAARGADQTVTAMPTNSAPASADVVLSVDVSDTSQAASGTNKKLPLSTLATFIGGGDVTAASAFGTDNRIIRSDGTGKGVQSTGITVDDSNNITGVTTLGATTTSTQTFSILDAVDQSHGLSFVVSSDLTAAKIFAYTGPYNFTMTLTGDTGVTFPTSGTLATLADIGGAGGADSLTGTHASPSTTTPLSPTWTGGEHDVFYGVTGTINLPAASTYAGKRVLVYNTGAFTITVAPQTAEVIVREGNVQTAGFGMTLSSGAGNYVELLCDGVRWVTLAKVGTLAVGSGPPTGFDAATYGTVYAWYRAQDVVGADGSAVAAWDDHGPNNHDLAEANAALQPVLQTAEVNGINAVRFDGSGRAIGTGAVSSSNIGTVIAVVGRVTYAPASAVAGLSTAGGAKRQTTFEPSATVIYAGDGSEFFGAAIPTRVNGALSSTFPGSLAYGVVSQAGTPTAMLGIALGASSVNAAFNGDILEIVFYSDALSTANQDAAANALKTKYGL